MNFNGHYDRPRKVNLGNSSLVSREDLLNRARAERQARAEKREREAAAKRLQRIWRFHRSFSASQDALLTSTLNGLETSGDNDSVYVIKFLALLPALERCKIDAEKLAELIEPLRLYRSQPWLCCKALKTIWALPDAVRPAPALASLRVMDSLKFEPGIDDARASMVCEPFFAFCERFLTAGGCTDEHSKLLHICANHITAATPMEAALAVVRHVTVVHAFTTEFLQPAYGISLPQQRLRELPPSAAAEVANALVPSAANALPLLVSLLVAAAVRENTTSGLRSSESGVPPMGDEFYRIIVSQSHELTVEITELLLAYLSTSSARALTWLSLSRLASGETLLAAALGCFSRSQEYALLQEAPTKQTIEKIASASQSNTDQGWMLLELALRILSHLMAATPDAQLLSITDNLLGIGIDTFADTARVVRNVAFLVLYYKPECPRLMFARTAILVAARQFYVRDGRRHFLPQGFWLMDSHMDQSQMPKISLRNMDLGSFGGFSDVSTIASSGVCAVLSQMPGFIQFKKRVELFNDELMFMRPASTPFLPFEVYDISRENLLQDSQQLFKQLGPQIRNDFRVAYVHDGLREAGIDGGGLTKELLILLCQRIFLTPDENSQAANLFIQNSEHFLYPRPQLEIDNETRELYFFAGQVVGKCIVEQVPVMVDFAPFFLRKWAAPLHAANPLDDLFSLDPVEYSSLIKLLSLEPDVADDLGLSWVISDGNMDHELVPGGTTKAVTANNRLEFVHAVADFRLNQLSHQQSDAFIHGLRDALDTRWLRLFSPSELQTLISGGSRDIDVEDLQAHAQMTGFSSSKYEREFWAVLRDFTPEQRGKFVQFVTSVPKAPLLGFKQLRPLFGIRRAGVEDDRLPTASTCFNLLKLPEYSSPDLLRRKLLQAIESNAGFDLS